MSMSGPPKSVLQGISSSAGTDFLTDTFTDSDNVALVSHTGELGGTWTKHSSYVTGASSITSNRTRAGNGNNSLAYASGAPATVEYDVSATFRCISTTLSSNGCGIAARIDTAANTMYFVRISSAAGGTWSMNELVAGSNTVLGATFLQVPVAGQDYAVILKVRDAVKEFWLDGVLRSSSTNNNITAKGVVGVRTGDQSTSGVHVADIIGTNR